MSEALFICPEETGELTEWKRKAVDRLTEMYSAESTALDAKIRAAAKAAIESGDGFVYDAIQKAINAEFTMTFLAVADDKGKSVETEIDLLRRTIKFGKRIK